MSSCTFNIIIDQSIGIPFCANLVVYGLNSFKKQCGDKFMMILVVSDRTKMIHQMEHHGSTVNIYEILSQEFQKQFRHLEQHTGITHEIEYQAK